MKLFKSNVEKKKRIKRTYIVGTIFVRGKWAEIRIEEEEGKKKKEKKKELLLVARDFARLASSVKYYKASVFVGVSL